MSHLRSFAPWIAYVAVSAVADWRIAAALALAVAVVAVIDQRRTHGEVDAIASTTAIFFVGLTAVSLASPDTALHRYAPALSLAALGAAAATSLLRGRPFTLTIAKRTAPRELWDLPLFFDANVVITAVWAVSFLVTALVCASVLAVAPQATPVWVTAEVIGFLVPIKFTAAYRQRLRTRMASVA